MNTYKKRQIRLKLISLLSIAIFLVLWQLATAVFELVPSYSLPSPVKVFTTFFQKFYTAKPDGSTLPQHILESSKIAFSGLGLGALIGLPLGILMGWIPAIDKLVRPIFDFLKPIPPIAIIPIMIVFFGIGVKSKAVVVCFSTIIPCIINAHSGIRQTNQIHLWVGQTFGATRMQQLFTVALPSSLPMIFAGLRVAVGASWMALVAAELMGATRGVGYMIATARNLLRSDIIIAGLLTLGIIGIAISLFFDLIERKFVRGGM